jgi:hypothetical protein
MRRTPFLDHLTRSVLKYKAPKLKSQHLPSLIKFTHKNMEKTWLSTMTPTPPYFLGFVFFCIS